jgi:hypothetical protein
MAGNINVPMGRSLSNYSDQQVLLPFVCVFKIYSSVSIHNLLSRSKFKSLHISLKAAWEGAKWGKWAALGHTPMQTLGISNDLENVRVVKSVSVILDPNNQAERNINSFARQTKPSQAIIRIIFLNPLCQHSLLCLGETQCNLVRGS